jgi:hypothetical protein
MAERPRGISRRDLLRGVGGGVVLLATDAALGGCDRESNDRASFSEARESLQGSAINFLAIVERTKLDIQRDPREVQTRGLTLAEPANSGITLRRVEAPNAQGVRQVSEVVINFRRGAERVAANVENMRVTTSEYSGQTIDPVDNAHLLRQSSATMSLNEDPSGEVNVVGLSTKTVDKIDNELVTKEEYVSTREGDDPMKDQDLRDYDALVANAAAAFNRR